jgi:hypothetical protein
MQTFAAFGRSSSHLSLLEQTPIGAVLARQAWHFLAVPSAMDR